MKPSSPSHGQGGYPALARLAQACGRPLWVVDLEATGGDLSNPEFGAVEIGWVLIRADGSWEEGSHLTDPGFPMDPYAQRLTGIERSMYQGQPSLAQRWPQVGPLFFESLVCGFGVEDLDCRALGRAAEEAGAVVEGAKIRSLDARKLWVKHSGSKKGRLLEVAQAFGHEGDSCHRALDDARACARAMDGLVQALGAEASLSMSRSWFPGIPENTELLAAKERGRVAAQALAAAKGSGSFEGGLRALAEAGTRAHWAPKGLSWWVKDQRAECDGGPRNIAELAEHFGASAPPSMAELDSLTRCRAFFGQAASAGQEFPSDEEASLICVCRSAQSAATARMNMIRSGELAPWSGVDAPTRELAQALVIGAQNESEALQRLREKAPAGMRSGLALGVCAASWAAQLRELAPKLPKP